MALRPIIRDSMWCVDPEIAPFCYVLPQLAIRSRPTRKQNIIEHVIVNIDVKTAALPSCCIRQDAQHISAITGIVGQMSKELIVHPSS
jgi:hypothetical protein